MICLSAQKPLLDITPDVWSRLADADLINVPVPLLNPPVEFEGRLFWDGAALMMVTPIVASFASAAEEAARMPYDEMFRVIESPDGAFRAQIYSIFFAKDAGEWRMFYRLLNVDRVLMRDASTLPGWRGDLPCSRWTMAASEMSEWLTADAFVSFYCSSAGYDACAVGDLVLELLARDGCSPMRAHMTAGDGGMAVLVPTTGLCCSTVIDLSRPEAISLLLPDDPSHFVSLYWVLADKMLLSAADRFQMTALTCDAKRFSIAARAAREQIGALAEPLSAAAFYM